MSWRYPQDERDRQVEKILHDREVLREYVERKEFPARSPATPTNPAEDIK